MVILPRSRLALFLPQHSIKVAAPGPTCNLAALKAVVEHTHIEAQRIEAAQHIERTEAIQHIHIEAEEAVDKQLTVEQVDTVEQVYN